MDKKTCRTCKWFYTFGTGYSNYTWEATHPACAIDKAPQFDGKEIPYDWNIDNFHQLDNWPVTNNSRCDSYVHRPWHMVEFDVDGDVYNEWWPADYWDFIINHHWGDYEHKKNGKGKPNGPVPLNRTS